MFGIDDAVGVALKILDKYLPDPKAKAEAATKLLEMKQNGEFKEIESALAASQQQTDINKAEATNENIFVSGWRPGIGWTCATAMFYSFVLQPFLISIVLITQCVIRHTPFDKSMLPIIDMSQLWPVLLGMLGLGVMRTVEKVQGVNSGR